ncbi:MAG: prohibitin family protein [Deltaproteobacteria bacterium]|nr:MAG: prohibitin family protein [Deltaproteobacteria bacterium]
MIKSFKLFMAMALFISVQGCIFYSTGETEVGVRTKKLTLFGEKGVEKKVYAPGSTYMFLPLINDWHTFDIKLQNLEFTRNINKGDRGTKDDLLLKTIDGNDISLDVIIVYRIDPEKAYLILQNVARNNQELRDKIVRTIARSKPRDIFGELKTEEFYVSKKREAQAVKAKDILQQMFDPMGIIIEKVLTKDYRFNPKYQQAIEDKKVADQKMEKNKSAQHAVEEEYKRKLEEAKGEVNKLVADVDGEFLKAKIKVDVYYEKQELLAQAIKAEGIAQAKGIQEMNNAMASAGGEALVKLQIAESLQGKKIVVLPVSEGGMNLKTTDINALLNTMGIKSIVGK